MTERFKTSLQTEEQKAKLAAAPIEIQYGELMIEFQTISLENAAKFQASCLEDAKVLQAQQLVEFQEVQQLQVVAQTELLLAMGNDDFRGEEHYHVHHHYGLDMMLKIAYSTIDILSKIIDYIDNIINNSQVTRYTVLLNKN